MPKISRSLVYAEIGVFVRALVAAAVINGLLMLVGWYEFSPRNVFIAALALTIGTNALVYYLENERPELMPWMEEIHDKD